MDLTTLLCFLSYFPSTLYYCPAFCVISLASFPTPLFNFLSALKLWSFTDDSWGCMYSLGTGQSQGFVVATAVVSCCCLTYWFPSSSLFFFVFFSLSLLVPLKGLMTLHGPLPFKNGVLSSCGQPSVWQSGPWASHLLQKGILQAPAGEIAACGASTPGGGTGALTIQWEQSAPVLSYVIAQSR